MHLHRNFSSSRLVRLLGDWSPVDAKASRQDFAERLGLWLDVSDAITLHAAHQSLPSQTVARATVADAGKTWAVEDEFQRVRSALVKAIAASLAPPTAAPRAQPATPPVIADADATFAPHHQRYLDLQRQMVLRIDALRDHVRQALSRTSPALAQLALLDSVLDQMLGKREQKLLATVPALLEKRFEQLRQTQGGPWLDTFGHDMHTALLAELDLRLQPVMGLVDAYRNENKKTP